MKNSFTWGHSGTCACWQHGWAGFNSDVPMPASAHCTTGYLLLIETPTVIENWWCILAWCYTSLSTCTANIVPYSGSIPPYGHRALGQLQTISCQRFRKASDEALRLCKVLEPFEAFKAQTVTSLRTPLPSFSSGTLCTIRIKVFALNSDLSSFVLK